jgi:hypothetical protein
LVDNHPMIHTLDLSDCSITDHGLKHLNDKHIRHLEVANCNISSDGIHHIVSNLGSTLEVLNVQGSPKVTEKDLLFLVEKCGSLKTLKVDDAMSHITPNPRSCRKNESPETRDIAEWIQAKVRHKKVYKIISAHYQTPPIHANVSYEPQGKIGKDLGKPSNKFPHAVKEFGICICYFTKTGLACVEYVMHRDYTNLFKEHEEPL